MGKARIVLRGGLGRSPSSGAPFGESGWGPLIMSAQQKACLIANYSQRDRLSSYNPQRKGSALSCCRRTLSPLGVFVQPCQGSHWVKPQRGCRTGQLGVRHSPPTSAASPPPHPNQLLTGAPINGQRVEKVEGRDFMARLLARMSLSLLICKVGRHTHLTCIAPFVSGSAAVPFVKTSRKLH